MHPKENQTDLFAELIHFDNQKDRGWDFNTGYPEFWALKSKLLVPGGRVLELGSELGYNSLLFALCGMSVTAIDHDPHAVAELKKVAAIRELPFEVRQEDVLTTQLEANAYDLVLLNDLLIHLHSKAAAYEILDKAITAIKPGGHLFLRASGKDSDNYQDYQIASTREDHVILGTYDYRSGGYHTAELIGPDAFTVKCFHHGGHGSVNGETFTFFEQNELLFHFITSGLRIIQANTLPTADKPNVMFGEDMDNYQSQYGIITLLGQNPV